MPIIQAVTLESTSHGAIEMTSHDFESPLTRLIARLWTEGSCPRFADALRHHAASQRERGVGLCHALAQAVAADRPELRHYWSARRGGTDHSWVELRDETLDTLWTMNDEPALNVMCRDTFLHEHRAIRPRRWTERCGWR